MHIAVFGLGYVGCSSAACLLAAGHHILGIDIDARKTEAIAQGVAPIIEEGVQPRLQAGLADGRLKACGSLVEAEPSAIVDLDMALMTVGTPPLPGGALDPAHVLAATRSLGAWLKGQNRQAPLLIVYRCTLMPGTTEKLILPALLEVTGEAPGRLYEVVLNPEFLREASAIKDYLAPPKIVIGERSAGISRQLRGLYRGIEAPLFEVPYATAEMIKLCDNSFHALKVTFANEIGRLCHANAIDPHGLAEVFLADTKLNISTAYLRPGGPYGGSCLEKDLGALLALGKPQTQLPMLAQVRRSNEAHLAFLLQQISRRFPRPGPVLQIGLSFKSGTDDLRSSPFVILAQAMLDLGFDLLLFDPDVEGQKAQLPEPLRNRLTDDLKAAQAQAAAWLIAKPLPEIAGYGDAGGKPVIDLARFHFT